MRLLVLCVLGLAGAGAPLRAQQDPALGRWQEELALELPLLGQRNWIVIADAAYPWQTTPGTMTVVTNAEPIDVVRGVLARLAKAPHVKPLIYTDAELADVPEEDARGVSAYRAALAETLGAGTEVRSRPHAQILADLQEAGKSFHVLVLKTKLTIPYSSVFIQLDSAYWNADAEKRLRDAMAP